MPRENYEGGMPDELEIVIDDFNWGHSDRGSTSLLFRGQVQSVQ